MKSFLFFIVFTLSGIIYSFADSPLILDVKVNKQSKGTFNFAVTVRHADTGWKHYVNKWEVVTLDGKLLGTRKLWHPHENEQPFTRSLGGVSIPSDITKVKVRAHDSVHGYGEKDFEVQIKH